MPSLAQSFSRSLMCLINPCGTSPQAILKRYALSTALLSAARITRFVESRIIFVLLIFVVITVVVFIVFVNVADVLFFECNRATVYEDDG